MNQHHIPSESMPQATYQSFNFSRSQLKLFLIPLLLFNLISLPVAGADSSSTGSSSLRIMVFYYPLLFLELMK